MRFPMTEGMRRRYENDALRSPWTALSQRPSNQNDVMNPLQRLADRISENEALDRIADKISQSLDGALEKVPERARVQDFLHGKWLGHPLHPMLTDIPIGAWSVAAMIDATETVTGKQTNAAARAIQFGMLAAIPTALAGAMDWRHTGGGARRVGVAHALLNNGALGLYALSLVLRPNHIGVARMLSAGGLSLVGVSGYLGGHLISHMRVGVKHEAEPAGEPTFFSEASLNADLAEDTPRQIEIDGTPLVVVKHGGQLYALSDVCPHLGCLLSEGSVSGDAIVCPCHGSTFALEDGRVIHGPSAFPVQSYHPSLPGAELSPGPVLDPGME